MKVSLSKFDISHLRFFILMNTASTKIIYLGFNNMFKHKRGVENVIDFQSRASLSEINYYIHWDDRTAVYHYKNFLCIGIKSNIYKFFVLNWFLLRIKKREKSIFIHSHNTLMSMLSIFQSNLFTVHDALYYQNKTINHKLKNVFYLLEIFLYKRVKYVHFISNYAREMSLYSGKKNHVIIPNTSHLENYKKDYISKGNKPIVKFNDSSIKVFVVRSIEERARIDLLIKVAEEMTLINENYEFLIAGKGPLYDFYKQNIEMLGLKNIKMLGYVSDEDLIEYYSDCDIVLMPAEYGEGFGLPIIEGYLFDKPVISSNVCAIPEVIISSDFLFENTVKSLISKLDFVRKQNKVQYKNYYNKQFSNKVVLSKMNELYKRLL